MTYLFNSMLQTIRGIYGDAVVEVDESIGKVMAALDRLQLREETLVVFTSDNGPWHMMGTSGGSSGVLHGQKGETYEGGYRVPCIMSWPSVMPEAQTSFALTSMMDLFPTFVELSGQTLPKNLTLDSYSLKSLILAGNKTVPSPREILLYYTEAALFAVRYKKFKVHYFTKDLTDIMSKKQDPPLVFNLESDPGEDFSLDATSHADVIAITDKIFEQYSNLPVAPSEILKFNIWGAPCCSKRSNPVPCACDHTPLVKPDPSLLAAKEQETRLMEEAGLFSQSMLGDFLLRKTQTSSKGKALHDSLAAKLKKSIGVQV